MKKYKIAKNIKIYLTVIFVFLIFLIFLNISHADNLKDAFSSEKKPFGVAGYNAGYDISDKNVDPIIGTIIQSALSFLGVIFVILIIYGGYLWMGARGNEQQVEKAKNLFIAAAIGLIIVISAYAISYFVIKGLSTGALKAPAP